MDTIWDKIMTTNYKCTGKWACRPVTLLSATLHADLSSCLAPTEQVSPGCARAEARLSLLPWSTMGRWHICPSSRSNRIPNLTKSQCLVGFPSSRWVHGPGDSKATSPSHDWDLKKLCLVSHRGFPSSTCDGSPSTGGNNLRPRSNSEVWHPVSWECGMAPPTPHHIYLSFRQTVTDGHDLLDSHSRSPWRWPWDKTSGPSTHHYEPHKCVEPHLQRGSWGS